MRFTLYEDYRHRLSQRAKTCIFVNLEELFTDASPIRETAKFLVRANSRCFPKKEVAKTHPLKASCEVSVTPQYSIGLNRRYVPAKLTLSYMDTHFEACIMHISFFENGELHGKLSISHLFIFR